MGTRAATGGFDASGIDAEAWEVLEGQLEATIPNYDRVNKWMTFGQDKRWRRNVRNHATPGMKVLEVGCGPGSFAEDLVGMDLTCLDPSPEMLATAQPRVDAARARVVKGPPIMFRPSLKTSRCPTTPTTWSSACFRFGTSRTRPKVCERFTAC